ncbi:hypothetical protein INR49_005227, partial [Caranx melampygus]
VSFAKVKATLFNNDNVEEEEEEEEHKEQSHVMEPVRSHHHQDHQELLGLNAATQGEPQEQSNLQHDKRHHRWLDLPPHSVSSDQHGAVPYKTENLCMRIRKKAGQRSEMSGGHGYDEDGRRKPSETCTLHWTICERAHVKQTTRDNISRCIQRESTVSTSIYKPALQHKYGPMFSLHRHFSHYSRFIMM